MCTKQAYSKKICYTRPVKKHKQQKRTATHSEKPFPEISMAIANVPVKISIWHGKTKLEEYEDEIALEFSDTTPEGKRNIRHCLYLTIEKGLSTEGAIFMLASKQAKEFSQQLVEGL